MLIAFLSLVSLALYVTFAAAVPYVRRDVNVDVAGLLGAHADGAVTVGTTRDITMLFHYEVT